MVDLTLETCMSFRISPTYPPNSTSMSFEACESPKVKVLVQFTQLSIRFTVNSSCMLHMLRNGLNYLLSQQDTAAYLGMLKFAQSCHVGQKAYSTTPGNE